MAIGDTSYAGEISGLVAKGFLAHVKALRDKGEKRLFAKFPGGRDGYGQAASRWFGRHRKKHKLQPDFHALRHYAASRTMPSLSIYAARVAPLLGVRSA